MTIFASILGCRSPVASLKFKQLVARSFIIITIAIGGTCDATKPQAFGDSNSGNKNRVTNQGLRLGIESENESNQQQLKQQQHK